MEIKNYNTDKLVYDFGDGICNTDLTVPEVIGCLTDKEKFEEQIEKLSNLHDEEIDKKEVYNCIKGYVDKDLAKDLKNICYDIKDITDILEIIGSELGNENIFDDFSDYCIDDSYQIAETIIMEDNWLSQVINDHRFSQLDDYDTYYNYAVDTRKREVWDDFVSDLDGYFDTSGLDKDELFDLHYEDGLDELEDIINENCLELECDNIRDAFEEYAIDDYTFEKALLKSLQHNAYSGTILYECQRNDIMVWEDVMLEAENRAMINDFKDFIEDEVIQNIEIDKDLAAEFENDLER